MRNNREIKMSWEENVRKVTPYIPGEQPKEKNIIKLNTNENPYEPAPAVRELIQNMDFASELRKYPDPAATKLVNALSNAYNVPEDQIFVGVGSDDVIAMSYLAFFNSEKPILFPDITYSFYDVWAEEFRVPYETIPLKEDFTLDVEGFLKENGGVIIPNPNAPTGVLESLEDMEKIVKNNPNSVVIIDEAYVDFGGVSALPLIEKYENLLVVQTFSKSRSMAGARIGFAFGSKKLIKYLMDVKYSFNSYTMDRITIEIGAKALEDAAYFNETCSKIIETREWAKGEFVKLGFKFADSKSNFLFVSHESKNAKDIFEALKKEGIFVRYFNRPRIDNYLRITIGTREEMEKLFAFLKDFLL